MKFLNSVIVQFQYMIHKLGFKFSFFIMFIFGITSYLNNVRISMSEDISVIISADSSFALSSYNSLWGLFTAILPFIIVFPYAFSYLEDNRLKIIPYVVNKTGKTNYFLSKTTACFIGGFLIIFIPFILNLILCHITFPDNYNTSFGIYNTSDYISNLTGSNVIINTEQKGLPLLKLYLINPFAYNLLYLCFFSLFSGILSVFSLACSFYLRKYNILLLVPTYLFFYIGNILDSYSYSSASYTNYDWITYVCIDNFYGKDYKLFFCILLFIILFIVLSLIYAMKRDEY